MNDLIDIDGSQGEGGGQVLRSSLTLSLLTGKPFHLRHIRAGRSKPGLQPQHLTCVEAAAEIGSATLRGASIGSTDLSFTPKQIQPNNYRFDIGTAGATSLVLHTVCLPLALRSPTPCEVTLTGGTHVSNSPAYHFLDGTWCNYFEAMGIRVSLRMERPGFFPRGGGMVRAVIQPCASITPITLAGRGDVSVSGIVAVAGLDRAIARRMARQASKELSALGLEAKIEEQSWDGGPGAIVALRLHTIPAPTVFVGIGARGKPAEEVADEAVAQVEDYLKSDAIVDEHSADQLVLPLALAAGSSEYRVGRVTQHLLTNVAVIKRFVDRDILCEGEEGQPGRILVR